MKNREKFFVIFTITIIILSALYVIKANVERIRINEDMTKIKQEIYMENGGIFEQYTQEIEDRVQNYLSIKEDEQPRELAVAFYLNDVVFEHLVEAYSFLGPMLGVMNLVFYSFVITIFIHAMLTVEYKNKKQYLIANSIIILIYFVLAQIDKLIYTQYLEEGRIIFNYNSIDYSEHILPIMYLVFLTGNSIKNKKKVLLFNAVVLDLLVLGNIIFTAITGTLDISWDFVIFAFLPFFIVESIILLIEKCVKRKSKKTEK